MDIAPEKLERIVRATVEELVRQLRAKGASSGLPVQPGFSGVPGSFKADQSMYRTPVLTLSMVERLAQGGTVVVSRGTIVSPLAAERAREKNLKIVEE